MSTTALSPVPTFADVARLNCLDTFIGVGGVELTIASRSLEYAANGRDFDVTGILATSDGKAIEVDACNSLLSLADGEPTVYVERWNADGSGWHGWADAESRRVVQVG